MAAATVAAPPMAACAPNMLGSKAKALALSIAQKRCFQRCNPKPLLADVQRKRLVLLVRKRLESGLVFYSFRGMSAAHKTVKYPA